MLSPGLHVYSGIRIYGEQGEEIANHDGGCGDWLDYNLDKDERIKGLYGQLHNYFGYIVQLGLITNKIKMNA